MQCTRESIRTANMHRIQKRTLLMKGYGRPASPSVKEGIDATGRDEDYCEGTS
jgi:hypothetical protein